ncbi:PadR family transcriptional regulator [Paenibacillus allorhizosphaerae]|nr:PadR family transcriptional regulator [Paenibacillus allorhizosphaerae]
MTMKKTNTTQRSPLAIAVLALLTEEPMHPYRIQQLIKERGKDEVINVRQRTNIYQTIDRLLRDGLISVRETARETGKPDRTIYEATDEGRGVLAQWLREILSTPCEEFPEFPVAVSFAPMLTSEDTTKQLETRLHALEQELGRLDSLFATHKDVIPRLFMLEMEYKRAMLVAELEWVGSVVMDLRTGALTWNDDWLREITKQFESRG